MTAKNTGKTALAALCLCALLAGCSSVSDSFNNFLENDANIGKNAPAVMGTVSEIVTSETSAGVTEAQTAAEEAFEKQTKRAEEIVSGMTVGEKIGQLLLARCPDDPVQVMEQYYLGGFTLYAEDFEDKSPEDIKFLTADIAKAAKTAPFIAVDEEGGTVVRVSKFPQFRDEPFSSPQLLFNRGGTELLSIDGREKARLLLGLGINFNLAPVADISTNEDSYIYPRTLGQGAESTSEGIRAIVETADNMGLASCLKHFPGYGENTDTHTGAAHDSRELYELQSRDFLPFEAGINATEDKTPAVMTGHTIYDNIDPDTPASLSAVIHAELRDKLSFDGVIMTDDMGMDAAAEYSGDVSPYVAAILADNDLICVTDHETAYGDITAAYNEGVITDEMLELHAVRVVRMKLQYGIIH